MKKTVILTGPDQRAQAKRLIEFLPEDGPLHRVTIEPAEDTRSARQNRYYWGPVVTIMSAELGVTKEELHRDHKYRFLVPIYIRDIPSFAEMIEAVKQVRRDNPTLADTLRKGIVNETSTTTASVKQMAEFITAVKNHANGLGIKLPAEE